MEEHRQAYLRDAATKQYDSAVESAKQFGWPELKEVFTAEEKNAAGWTVVKTRVVAFAFLT